MRLLYVQVLPAMVQAGHGTILFTGATAAIRGGAKFAALACPKFALRALSQSIAREFQPKVATLLTGLYYLPRIACMHACKAARIDRGQIDALLSGCSTFCGSLA